MKTFYFNEQNVFFAEPSIFEIFDIPIVSGDGKTGLDEPYTAMVSQNIAEKYFGSENPIGKTFQAAGDGEVMVTGVFEDFPFNSHFHPEILLSFVTMHDEKIYGLEGLRNNWGNNSFSTYIRLPKDYPTENLIAQFPDFLDKHLANIYGKYQPSKGTELTLTPLTDIHLHSHLDSEIEENGDMKRVKIFLIIAILILLIACINYMNLATARAANRAREIGIKKVVGARRGLSLDSF